MVSFSSAESFESANFIVDDDDDNEDGGKDDGEEEEVKKMEARLDAEGDAKNSIQTKKSMLSRKTPQYSSDFKVIR